MPDLRIVQWFIAFKQITFQHARSSGIQTNSLCPPVCRWISVLLGPMLYVMCAAPVSDIIQKYSKQHESFADEAQFQHFQKI